ncbi:MAG: hypothetical protein IPO80_00680 [Propionibacteriaceae bacterium]|nr:hypothetical protein [Propionibacteriaceae bacterium]
MSLRGMPDFGVPLQAAEFPAFELPGEVVGVPNGISIARDAEGYPRLRLERFRGVSPDRPPAPYGLLSVWLVAEAPTPSLATPTAPRARRAVPDRGVLRVQVDQLDAPAGLEIPPSPMAWDGSLTALWGTRLGTLSTTRLQECLADRFLPLHASADFEVRGVAPRLPVEARVNWPELAAGLAGVATGAGLVGRATLVSWLRTEVLAAAASPIQLLSGAAREDELAEVLTDWLRARFGSPAAQPTDNPGPDVFALSLDPSLAGSLLWDLATPTLTWRPLSISQDLLPQLRDLGPELSRYVPAGVDLPTIDLGWAHLDVLANLPGQQVGVLASGVNLLAPPHPPQRPQAVTATCEFTPDQPRGQVTLHLSPGEPITYRSQAWLVIEDPSGIREVTGPDRERDGQRLVLTPSDFGVGFVPVCVDDALLELADVEVTLRVADAPVGRASLTRGTRDAVFVTPSDPGGTLEVRLRSTLDGVERTLAPLPLESLWLGRASIPGWGPHTVEIDGTALDTPLTALEMRPELAADSDATPVALTAAQPRRSWRYFTDDPLHPGYWYRLRPLDGPGPWVGPLSPDQALVLAATP